MDNKNTDQWLRSSMKDYKPVPGGDRRARFLQEAPPLVASQKKGNNRKWLLLGFLLLLTGAFAIYLAMPEKKQLSAPALLSTNSTVMSNPAQLSQIDQIDSFTDSTDIPHVIQVSNEEVLLAKTSENQAIVEFGTFSRPDSVTSGASIALDQNEKVSVKETIIKTDLFTQATPVSDKLILEEPVIVSPAVEDGGFVSDSILTEVVSPMDETNETPQEIPQGVHSPKHLAYTLFYRSEITFNLIEDNKVSHGVGFDVQYRFFNDRYSIRTGLGLSISKGYYEYATDYQEYLGAYEKLDSITFAWDERQYHLNPTYYMSEKEVFEDTLTTTYSKINKQHYYLQIPMMLGYDFISTKTWRLGLRAGPRLSVLIKTKTLNQLEDWGKNRVIQINQITPERIQANWQFVGAANLGVMTKGRLFFELEPQFTYYFNSVYEKADYGKSPWSLSLRLAIGIK